MAVYILKRSLPSQNICKFRSNKIFVRSHKTDKLSRFSTSSCSACSMHKRGYVLGKIKLNDAINLPEIYASCCQISSYQNVYIIIFWGKTRKSAHSLIARDWSIKAQTVNFLASKEAQNTVHSLSTWTKDDHLLKLNLFQELFQHKQILFFMASFRDHQPLEL